MTTTPSSLHLVYIAVFAGGYFDLSAATLLDSVDDLALFIATTDRRMLYRGAHCTSVDHSENGRYTSIRYDRIRYGEAAA